MGIYEFKNRELSYQNNGNENETEEGKHSVHHTRSHLVISAESKIYISPQRKRIILSHERELAVRVLILNQSLQILVSLDSDGIHTSFDTDGSGSLLLLLSCAYYLSEAIISHTFFHWFCRL